MVSSTIEFCTEQRRSHCLDIITDDVIRYLVEEKDADVHMVNPYTSHNLLDKACLSYEESKLPVVLYYMSQKVPLRPLTGLYLIKYFGLRRRKFESNVEGHFMPFYGKQIISIFLIDNALVLSKAHIQPCVIAINKARKLYNKTYKTYSYWIVPGKSYSSDEDEDDEAIIQSANQSRHAGRLVVDLFDRRLPGLWGTYMEWDKFSESRCTLQPDLDLLNLLYGAGFVISIPNDLEEKLVVSDEETRKMTLNILQEELSRVPLLFELCRWEVRRILGPGLISMGKVDCLPLPKPIIEYILLLDIIEKEHAQTMYDYFSGKQSLKMACVTKNLKSFFGESICDKCYACDADEAEILKRQKERAETRKWAREFLEQCKAEDSKKVQESYFHYPEEWKVLDEI